MFHIYIGQQKETPSALSPNEGRGQVLSTKDERKTTVPWCHMIYNINLIN